MGCVGSRHRSLRKSTHIRLAPNDKSFYWSGEIVSGTVVFHNDELLPIDYVDVKFVGALLYDIPDLHASRAEDLIFFSKRYTLINSKSENKFSGKNRKFINLNPGTYERPFSIRLPENFPPSLILVGDGKLPYIHYFLEVEISIYKKITPMELNRLSIMVIPRVGLPRQVGPMEIDNENRKGVYVQVRFSRNYLLIGQTHIPLELYVHNPNQSTIKEVIVKLKQRIYLGIAGVLNAVLYTTAVPGLADFQGEHFHDTFPMHVLCPPEKLVPTSVYMTSKDRRSPWTINYTFEITFKIRGLLTNMAFQLPIVVINEK